jgi:hypothetical protein
VSGWYTAPLVVKEGSSRGEGTIDLIGCSAEQTPKERTLPFLQLEGFTGWVSRRLRLPDLKAIGT